MRARVLHRFDQLCHNMRGCGRIGIAHAKVNNILSRAARLGLGGVHLGKDIGRQAPDTVEILGHGFSLND